MLTRGLHALIADTRIDDLTAMLLGARVSARKIKRQAASVVPRAPRTAVRVLDLGGGTGRLRPAWPRDATYLCLDPDLRKLTHVKRVPGRDLFLAGSGDRLPFHDASFDAVSMVAVSHHLDDAVFDQTLREIRRVLHPAGRLIFLDAVWNARHLPGRLFWRYDRGSYPRPISDITARLDRNFVMLHRERYCGIHDYMVWVGTVRDD